MRETELAPKWLDKKQRAALLMNAKARKVLLDYLRVRPDVDNNGLFLGRRNERAQSKTGQRWYRGLQSKRG